MVIVVATVPADPWGVGRMNYFKLERQKNVFEKSKPQEIIYTNSPGRLCKVMALYLQFGYS